MSTHRWTAAILGALFLAHIVVADDNESRSKRGRGVDVAPVADARYARECGGCHFAYQPGLLPARSWQKVMSSLSDHFGDNAELSKEDAAAIVEYLTANAADRVDYKRSVKIVKALSDQETPVRISAMPYMVRKHDHIPARFVAENWRVKTLGNCPACHRRADTGSYGEHEIKIPGSPRWEED